MLLITGGAGYIGSHIVSLVGKQNIPCVVVDDLSTGVRRAVPKNIPFIQCDIGNVPAMTRIFKKYDVQAVIHLAASILPAESFTNPQKYYQNNAVNSFHLWSLCHAHNVRHVIFSSSAAVYGASSPAPVSERSAVHPTSPYGSSKVMAEAMLKDMDTTYRYVILRYFNVVGRDPSIAVKSKKTDHLLSVCMETALGKRPYVPVFGNDFNTPDGTGVRDYIHVSDVASAHMQALAFLEQGKKSVTCNVGYGRGTSVLDMIRIVHKVTGRKVPYKVFPRRSGDSAAVIADTRAITSLFGWIPHHENLHETVRTLWECMT